MTFGKHVNADRNPALKAGFLLLLDVVMVWKAVAIVPDMDYPLAIVFALAVIIGASHLAYIAVAGFIGRRE